MVNDIVSGVTKAIYDAYGDGCRIYTENVEQGLQEPCFFVALTSCDQTRIVGNRYQKNIAVCVHYFPKGKAKKREMQDAAGVLYYVLERIALSDGTMINGFWLHDEMADDVLHFFVTYRPIVMYQTEEEASMEEAALCVKAVE